MGITDEQDQKRLEEEKKKAQEEEKRADEEQRKAEEEQRGASVGTGGDLLTLGTTEEPSHTKPKLVDGAISRWLGQTESVDGVQDEVQEEVQEEVQDEVQDEGALLWHAPPSLEGGYEEQSGRSSGHTREMAIDFLADQCDTLDDAHGEVAEHLDSDRTDSEEEEEEEEEEEPEDGWEDAVEGSGYVARNGTLFEDYRGTRCAAIFAPLDIFRMLVIGWCTAVLIKDTEAVWQGGSILAIHVLQFVLEIALMPEPSFFDTALNAACMLGDLIPLVIVFMPASECGTMPLSTQMMMLGAALFNTLLRIVNTMATILPLVCGVGCMVMAFVLKILDYVLDRRREQANKARVTADDAGKASPMGRYAAAERYKVAAVAAEDTWIEVVDMRIDSPTNVSTMVKMQPSPHATSYVAAMCDV
jgi:hypothetical protein